MARTKKRKPGAAGRLLSAQKKAAALEAAAARDLGSTKVDELPSDAARTLYFYKPDKDHGFLSQWYQSPFISITAGHKYTTAEQYMMHSKALLFDPESDLCTKMLATDDPAELKRMGRLVQNFNEEVWVKNREEIVTEGNYLKFSQNSDLMNLLLETGDKQLVEASGRDRIWGIGFGASKAPYERKRWGKNLLGKALMAVRERLQKELNELAVLESEKAVEEGQDAETEDK